MSQGFNVVLQETFDSGWVYFSLERGGHYHCHLVGRSQNLLYFPQCTGQSLQQRRIWFERSAAARMGNPGLDLAQPSLPLPAPPNLSFLHGREKQSPCLSSSHDHVASDCLHLSPFLKFLEDKEFVIFFLYHWNLVHSKVSRTDMQREK